MRNVYRNCFVGGLGGFSCDSGLCYYSVSGGGACQGPGAKVLRRLCCRCGMRSAGRYVVVNSTSNGPKSFSSSSGEYTSEFSVSCISMESFLRSWCGWLDPTGYDGATCNTGPDEASGGWGGGVVGCRRCVVTVTPFRSFGGETGRYDSSGFGGGLVGTCSGNLRRMNEGVLVRGGVAPGGAVSVTYAPVAFRPVDTEVSGGGRIVLVNCLCRSHASCGIEQRCGLGGLFDSCGGGGFGG